MNILNINFYKKNLILKFSSFLFLLLPFFLISGPFFSDLILSLIVIFFIAHSIKEKKIQYFKNRFFIFFLIFYFYLILNSSLQNQNFDSLKISFTYLRFPLFCLACLWILNNTQNIIKNLYYIYLILFLLLIFDGLFQFFYGKNIFGYPLAIGPRVSSFFNDELILGSYLSRSFPLFFALFLYEFNSLSKKSIVIFCLVFILIEVLTFLSGERVAFFYLNLSVLFILFFVKKFLKLKIILLSLLIFIFLILINFFPQAKNRIINQTLDQMNITNEKEFVFFSKQHDDLYKTALKITKDNLIFGVGVKNFRNFCGEDKYKVSEYSCSTHPHNTYIQLFVELGIIGLIFISFLFSCFLYLLFKHFIQSLRNRPLFNDYEICLMSSVLIFLWPLAPTGNFFNNWLNVINFYPIGILFWSLYSKKNKTHKN